MRVISVVGARPQFIKLAPVDAALRAAGHEHVVVHTGQHYAPELSESLFADLRLPQPDVNLEVGSGSHARQTAAMMVGLEDLLLTAPSDWVLVYGDTNSTIAAALVAAKLHRRCAHLEAGLRSGNRLMPEEHNRIVTDHLADLLLAPTETAMTHLRAEGLGARSVNVGDVMTDVCLRVRDATAANPPAMPEDWQGQPGEVVATIHRAENTDDPARLDAVLSGLERTGLPISLVAHPRLVAKAAEFGLPLARGAVQPVRSLTYSQMVWAVSTAQGVITDSGGLQKESFLLETPCITVRQETEWPETLVDDWNVISPDLDVDAAEHFSRRRPARTIHPFGDGRAAEQVVAALAQSEGSLT